jgi:hypothetical protein
MCVRHVVFPLGHISHNSWNQYFDPALESLEATWQVIFHVNCQGSCTLSLRIIEMDLSRDTDVAQVSR